MIIIKTLIILIPLSLSQCVQLIAQDNLTGEWVSHSITSKNRETEIESKRDEIVIIFTTGQRYVKHFYTIKNLADSDTVKLYFSKNLMDGKFEMRNSNGKELKRQKITERGSYQIDNDRIRFVSQQREYTVPYQLHDGLLLLTENIASGEEYITKFKRH